MKKSLKFIAIIAFILFSTSSYAEELGLKVSNMNMFAAAGKSKASSGGKAFEGKGSKQINLGLAATSYIGSFSKGGFSRFGGGGHGYYGYYGYYGGGAFWISGGLSVQAEFGVHDYVGVGLVTGLVGRRSYMAIPVGVLANFHFFQLIADKKGVGVGDKLDLYVGLNFGTGIGVSTLKGLKGSDKISGIIFAGPQFGVKYFFTDKIGIYTELGYGKSIFEAGVSIKL